MSEQISVKNASDLFNALGHSRVEVRLAILKSVVENPARALALGPDEGEELPQRLVEMLCSSAGPERQLVVMALCLFKTDTTTEALMEEFTTSRDAGSLFAMARRLFGEHRDSLESFLWDAPTSPQARAVAALIGDDEELSPALRLRVALLTVQPFSAPSLDEEHVSLWMKELSGPLASSARNSLVGHQAPLSLLWEHREELSAGNLEWLVEQICQRGEEDCAEVLRWCLETDGLWERAYLWSVRLGLKLETDRDLLNASDPMVCVTAISRGEADGKLEQFLTSSDWMLRRAAVLRLAELKPDNLDGLKELALSSVLETRVAACETLRLLGQVEWLEDQVLLAGVR